MLKLERGINLGGWISQCHKYEEAHYQTFVTGPDLQRIAGMGFDHVRVPVDYNVLETEDGTPVESGWKHLDDVVAWTKTYGLDMIIDLHKAAGYDFNNAGLAANSLFTSEELQQRFLTMWERISARYGKETHVAFELLNEVVEDKNAAPWNELIARAVAVIRKNSADTPIIYGGICWNSTATLKLLEKPADPNIIFTFHFYEPLVFTHQRAGWVAQMDMQRVMHFPDTMEHYIAASSTFGQGNAVANAKAKDIGAPFFEERISEAIDAAAAAGVRLYCGEFGVIDQAPVPDTLNWFRVTDEVFRKHSIGCALWSYKSMSFGLIDEHYDAIRDDLLALWNGSKA